jgi:hypothetical protein
MLGLWRRYRCEKGSDERCKEEIRRLEKVGVNKFTRTVAEVLLHRATYTV